MKNKSILLIVLAVAAGQFFKTTTVLAQAQTGNTVLKVRLIDALSFTVNDAEVLLDFTNAADYVSGVTVTKAGHLTITSTKPFTINVKAATATLAGTGSNTNTIETNAVNVELPDPAGQGLGGTSAPVVLSTTDAALLTSAPAVSNKMINVKYAIPAANTAQVIGKAADTYSTTVTYTVTQ